MVWGVGVFIWCVIVIGAFEGSQNFLNTFVIVCLCCSNFGDGVDFSIKFCDFRRDEIVRFFKAGVDAASDGACLCVGVVL